MVNKEVAEVLPKGRLRPVFRDYLEFALTYSELVDLYAHEQANPEWRCQERCSPANGIIRRPSRSRYSKFLPA